MSEKRGSVWGRFSSVASGVQNRVAKLTDEAFNQAADFLVGGCMALRCCTSATPIGHPQACAWERRSPATMRTDSRTETASSRAPAYCRGRCPSWRHRPSAQPISRTASRARRCRHSQSCRSQRLSLHCSRHGHQPRSHCRRQHSNHQRSPHLSAANQHLEQLFRQSHVSQL
jgi:hypothetical protein